MVEPLANQVLMVEASGKSSHRVYAHRRAARASEDTDQDLGSFYRQIRCGRLGSIKNVGPTLAPVVAQTGQRTQQTRCTLTQKG